MIKSYLEAWLNTLELNFEQKVIASMAVKLAESFDENGNTSTAAELRKTIIELRNMIGDSETDFDPLESLLKR
jgi:hypothetical protein